MSSSLQRRGWCALTLALVAVALLAATARAAAGPAWTISSYATPTRIDPSAHGTDAVQEVVVRATGGIFLLEFGGPESRLGEGHEDEQAILPYNATAAEVQSALEGMSTVGPGNVSVTGGPGDETGSSPYLVTFTGTLGSQPILKMSVDSELELPGGGEGSIHVNVLQTGAAAANYVVIATNTGSEATKAGDPIVLEDTLPVEAQAGGVSGKEFFLSQGRPELLSCGLGPPVRCEYDDSTPVAVGDSLLMYVHLAGFAGSGVSAPGSASVSGGGAAEAASTQYTTPLGTEPEPYGVSNFYTALSSQQAGAHPNITTGITFNSASVFRPSGDPQELRVQLPPGFVGNPNPAYTPRCTMAEVTLNTCAATAAVGVASVRLDSGPTAPEEVYNSLVYNIVPYAGEPAAFAFFPDLFPVRLDTRLRSNGDYGVEVVVKGISQAVQISGASVTFWGVPAQFNGPGPYQPTGLHNAFGGPGAGVPNPFTDNPTTCASGAEMQLSTRSWQAPGVLVGPLATPFPTMQGCEKLRFEPSLRVTPTSFEPGAPAGYQTELEVPQTNSANTPATPAVRYATVTLPAGTVLSPSAAGGLEACSEAQVELLSAEPLKPARCPPASKLGEVEIQTPLLSAPLKGSLYLAEQDNNPFHSLIALYLVAEGSGVIVKLAGEGQLDPVSGQVTVSFKGNPGGGSALANGDPPLPFSLLKVQMTSGPRAALANPRSCGQALTTSSLTPYNAEVAATPSSEFTLEPCLSFGFLPTLAAGMTGTSQAGAYSSFSVTLARSDRDQELGGITVQTPPGLLGMVSHVAQCGEPAAAQGNCGPESQLGTVSVAVGPGPDPYWIGGGRVYLTGPYKGGPFGLSIVVPAQAGPFNLGEEVVRSAIYVNPVTAALSVVSDPLPTKKDGIPFQVKAVAVNIDRHEFTFNATDCRATAIGASLVSTQGSTSQASVPYQARDCAALPFAPKLTATVDGQGSKANGIGFHIHITSAGLGQANIAKSILTIPKILPARLMPTLQHACPEATFNANPAGCSEESVIGNAIVHTPVLKSPLSGPAYIVSHGNAAFPDVEFVLQGEGVTIVLDGKTDIKKGVTYSRFESVPDAPFTSFEANLPAGPHSIFTANTDIAKNYNVCKQAISLPTELTGQNGAVIRDSTKVAVTGCGPTVTIVGTKLKRNSILVTVRATAAGTVKVSGKGLKKTTKKLRSPGSASIRVALTRTGRAMRRHRRKVTVSASLTAGKGRDSDNRTLRL